MGHPLMYPWDRDPNYVWDKLTAPVFPAPDEWTALQEERLPAPIGCKGLKVREAIQRAAFWWDHAGRFMVKQHVPLMPERGGVPSGILRGLSWGELDRAESISVLRQWYTNIGTPQLIQERDAGAERFVLDKAAHVRAPKG